MSTRARGWGKSTPPSIILCGYCGGHRVWPDEFPNRLYVECAWCVAARREREAAERARIYRQRRRVAFVLAVLVLLALIVALALVPPAWWLDLPEVP